MFKEIVVANKNYAVCAASNPQSLDKTAVKVIRSAAYANDYTFYGLRRLVS